MYNCEINVSRETFISQSLFMRTNTEKTMQQKQPASGAQVDKFTSPT